MGPRSLLTFTVLVVPLVGMVSEARAANDAMSCAEASERGQQLRDEGNLVDGREQLMRCSAESCPRIIQRDCVQWLGEVTSALPSVVLSAKDADGHDVLHLRVLADGRVITKNLDGKALFVNPGPHTLRFEPTNGSPFEQTIIVREGEKNRMVSVTLPRAATETASVPVVVPEPAASTSNAKRTAGVVIGGIGILSVGVGAYFGVRAIGQHSDSDKECPNGKCTPQGADLSHQALTSAWISNVGIGLGLVGLGVGTYLLLTSRTSNGAAAATTTSANVRVLPKAEPGGGGFAVAGRF